MAGKNVYDMVTERIIAELEKGSIPWEKPWTGVRSGAYNRVSKKAYSLLNQMLLKRTLNLQNVQAMKLITVLQEIA